MQGARQERLAQEIRLIVGELLSRQQIKDPRVQNAGIITISHVRVTGDLRQARVAFMVHSASESELLGVQEGLNSASGFMRRKIANQMRIKVIPSLSFAIDRVYASEERVDNLLESLKPEQSAEDTVEVDGNGDSEAENR